MAEKQERGTMFANFRREESTQPSTPGQVDFMARFDLLSPSALSGPGTSAMEVVEIPVLLPGWQASALEDAAHERGQTAGEMLRHLLADFLKPLRGQGDSCETRRNGSPVLLK
jgi:hypothetical protein